MSLCTYIGIILLGLRLVYGSMKEIFSHSFVLLSISSLLLSCNELHDGLVWFFFFLYLVIYNLYEHILKGENAVSVKKISLINLLGLVAGISHELIGAWFLFQFIFGTFIRTHSIKKTLINCKYLAGTIIGYIICFVAPGNFVRASHQHEAGLSTPIIPRMVKSFSMHKMMFFTYENIGKWIFASMTLLAIGSFVFLWYKKEFKYWGWVIEKIVYIFVSVVLWG